MLNGIGLGRDFYDAGNWRPDGTPHFSTAGALSSTFLLTRAGQERVPEVFSDTSLGSLQRRAQRHDRDVEKAAEAAKRRVELSQSLVEQRQRQLRRQRQELRRQTEACVTVQAASRGFLARARLRQANQAAERVQKWQRERALARAKRSRAEQAIKATAKEEETVAEVARVQTAQAADRTAIRVSAAVKIQCMVRCEQARKRMQDRAREVEATRARLKEQYRLGAESRMLHNRSVAALLHSISMGSRAASRGPSPGPTGGVGPGWHALGRSGAAAAYATATANSATALRAGSVYPLSHSPGSTKGSQRGSQRGSVASVASSVSIGPSPGLGSGSPSDLGLESTLGPPMLVGAKCLARTSRGMSMHVAVPLALKPSFTFCSPTHASASPLWRDAVCSPTRASGRWHI